MSSSTSRAEALSRIRKAPVEYLPVPWGPPLRRPYTKADSESVYRSEPRRSLHRSQLPYSFRPWKPGVVHCGYLADEKLFFDYAAKHGLTHYKILDGHIKKPHILYTVSNCLAHMCNNLKIARHRSAHVITKAGYTGILISFTNNYALHKHPSLSDMKKLQEFLGESEDPMWYLDNDKWWWEYRPPRRT